MNKSHNWTADEERVLADQISKHPNNFKKAYENTSAIINRSVSACQNYWYRVLSNKTELLDAYTKSFNQIDKEEDYTDIVKSVSISPIWWHKLINTLKGWFGKN